MSCLKTMKIYPKLLLPFQTFTPYLSFVIEHMTGFTVDTVVAFLPFESNGFPALWALFKTYIKNMQEVFIRLSHMWNHRPVTICKE